MCVETCPLHLQEKLRCDTIVLTGSGDGEVGAWDAETGQAWGSDYFQCDGKISSMSFVVGNEPLEAREVAAPPEVTGPVDDEDDFEDDEGSTGAHGDVVCVLPTHLLTFCYPMYCSGDNAAKTVDSATGMLQLHANRGACFTNLQIWFGSKSTQSTTTSTAKVGCELEAQLGVPHFCSYLCTARPIAVVIAREADESGTTARLQPRPALCDDR